MRWTVESSKPSTSIPEHPSAGCPRSSDPPSRPSPAATGGCSTPGSCVSSARSIQQRLGRSDWVVRIRCAPGSAPTVANRLAEHPDTAWVQLTSGGTEIFSTIHSRNRELRTPLLLSQLSVGRQVVALEAYCLLHIFATGASPPPASNDLSPAEIHQLLSPARSKVVGRTLGGHTARRQTGHSSRRSPKTVRATYRQLAERIHWHESTVRRRVEELVTAGVLSFDVDLDTEAFGLRSPALLWMSVVPARLAEVGQALAGRPEIKFVAATTGSTNLVAAVVCEDDRSLYEFITGDIAALDGLTHVETAPVMRAVKMHATIARSRS